MPFDIKVRPVFYFLTLPLLILIAYATYDIFTMVKVEYVSDLTFPALHIFIPVWVATFLLLVVCHEMGHVIMGKFLGMKLEEIEFVVGARVYLGREKPRTPVEQILVSFSGPVLHIIAAISVIWLTLSTEMYWLSSVGFLSLLDAVINLLPIMDGSDGRKILDNTITLITRGVRKIFHRFKTSKSLVDDPSAV